MSSPALNELGIILAITEKLLILAYSPYKVIFANLGFSSGLNFHFHIIPVLKSMLYEIIDHPNYTKKEPDGNDVMLFISREYCERIFSTEEKLTIKNTTIYLNKLFTGHLIFNIKALSSS